MKKVYVFDPNRYKVISEGNAFIYLKYDALKSFLRANFREEIQQLLLKPVKNNNEIEFWAEQTGSFSELNSFDSAKQEKIILKYSLIKKQTEKMFKKIQEPEKNSFNLQTLIILSKNPPKNKKYNKYN